MLLSTFKIGLPKFCLVQTLRISLNLEPDFRFSLGNLLNFELDLWFRFRMVQVQRALNSELNCSYTKLCVEPFIAM